MDNDETAVKLTRIDLLLLIFQITAGVLLLYNSFVFMRYDRFIYLKYFGALSLISVSILFFKNSGLSPRKPLSTTAIILGLFLAEAFLIRHNLYDWRVLEFGSAAFLITALCIFLFGISKGKKIYLARLRDTLTTTFLLGVFGSGLLLAGFGVYSIGVSFLVPPAKIFTDLAPTQQIVELSPWEDYMGNRWLFLEKNGTYTIRAGHWWEIDDGENKTAEEKMPVEFSGKWLFDNHTGSVILDAGTSIAKYRYLLQHDMAYLGTGVVENDPLNSLWFAGVPLKK